VIPRRPCTKVYVSEPAGSTLPEDMSLLLRQNSKRPRIVPGIPRLVPAAVWRTVSISKTTTERLYSPPERITLSLGYCICVFWTSTMPPDPHFLRTPNRTNSEITDSFCVFCQTFVGASPRPTLLRLMEDAHACEQIRRHRSGESSGVGKKRILRRKKSV
jgi:hypothetical protein